VLIKYQTNTTAMMLSAVVTPCGSISAHAVSHVPLQTNCPGTQLLHNTPVYLHNVRRSVRTAWACAHAGVCLRVCVGRRSFRVCLCSYPCACHMGGERYLSSHSKFGPPLQCPASHCQNRAMSAWQIAASGQAIGGSTPGGSTILRLRDVWLSLPDVVLAYVVRAQ
jgi:hypothetical protein